MGSDVYGGTESIPSPRAIKVHCIMCAGLIQLVNRVLEIFPEIEAARPCCSSGIEALCLLNNAIIKAKQLLRHCSMSSKLYLALTGDAILSRCNKSRNLLEQSLSQMQSMVPVLLAGKMSQVVFDLRHVSFSLDPHENEAGKVLLDLIHRYGSDKSSVEGTALQAIQFAAVRLHIGSQKALLIEKRSIKNQLDDIKESYPQKKNILLFFQNLLKKYGNLIVKELKDDDSLHRYLDVESRPLDEIVLQPEEEFKRPPLSSRTQSRDTSSSSISSLSMMGDLSLRLDVSDFSVGSSDSKPDSDSSYSRSSESCSSFNNGIINKLEIDSRVPIEFGSLPWESRVKLVKDMEMYLNHGYHYCGSKSCENLGMSISKFLKESVDYLDVEVQKNGCLLFLAFLKNCRSSISCLEEEIYAILASFLESDVANESLGVIEELSCRNTVIDNISSSSGALINILDILTKQVARFREPESEPVLRTLLNFSSNTTSKSFLVPSTLVPALLPSLENTGLSNYGIAIIENMCSRDDFRAYIAETDGCISSIAKLLENESYIVQENAVGVLLSLCNQSVEYCDLVLDEGVIPDLVDLTNNGTNKGKAMATELLRLLRNQVDEYEEEEESNASDFQESEKSENLSVEKKVSSKGNTGIFKKFKIFSKHCSCNSSTRRETIGPGIVINTKSSLSRKS